MKAQVIFDEVGGVATGNFFDDFLESFGGNLRVNFFLRQFEGNQLG